MLKLRNHHGTWKIYLAILLDMILILSLFVSRVILGNEVTPCSTGELLGLSEEYQAGNILDRNGEFIAAGIPEGICWYENCAWDFWDDILGTHIGNTFASRFTVMGNCPWVYGTEDNRLTLQDLLNSPKTRVGGNVHLTLDLNLQEYIAEQILQKGYEKAYVVVSDYTSGEILAAYGKVTTERFHPGSTIKPILAASALSLDPELSSHVYSCEDANHNFLMKKTYTRINCNDGVFHGQVAMSDAITISCNGYFVDLVQQIDHNILEEELKKWGFDTVVSYPQFMYWDHSFTGGSDRIIDYYQGAIGQANAFITPLGLNLCTNALLHHGVLEEPVWILEKQGNSHENWDPVDRGKAREICNAQAADKVRDMMLRVTAEGTGKSFYLPGFAAKTGTAQKPDGKGGISGRYTVWTTGGLTDENYPYSITVCLDDVGREVTAANAGSLAKDILSYLMLGGDIL